MKTLIGSDVFLNLARLRLVTRMRASNLPNTKVFSNQVTLKENVKGSFSLRRSECECDIAFRWQFNIIFTLAAKIKRIFAFAFA